MLSIQIIINSTIPHEILSAIFVLLIKSSIYFHTMKTLNVILALVLFITIAYVEPNMASRVLNTRNKLQLQSLDKGPVTPSGPSGCTFIPGSGGTKCPVEEMNFAGDGHRRPDYPRLFAPFGVAINQ